MDPRLKPGRIFVNISKTKKMKKQTLFNLTSMPKMIFVIAMIVLLGTWLGAVGYLMSLSKICEPTIPIVSEIQKVIVTTDKTEYERGENVEIRIKNDLDEEIIFVLEILTNILPGFSRGSMRF